MMKKKIITLLASLLIVAAWGCSTSEKTTRKEDDSSTETDQPIFEMDSELIEAYLIEEMSDFDRVLFENRSTLSDQFASIEQEIPEVFLKDIVYNEEIVDEFAGYRVQLLSTRSIAEADSTKDNFRVWAEDHIQGYSPQTYIIFRQPYYKVRVGDFRDQEQANDFSRMVKNEFPGAWVVHDRIEPFYIPADTTEIRRAEL